MFCTHCGAQMPDDATFCTKCGQALPQTQSASVSEPAASSSHDSPEARELATYAGKPPVNPAAHRKAVAAVIAFVIAALGIFVVYRAFFAPYDIDEKNFPDQAFRTYIARIADADNDGKITRDEAKNVSEIDVPSDVVSLKGIELFPNVDTVDAVQCPNLSEVDLSHNGNISTLNFDTDSHLESLDVSALEKLVSLNIEGSSVESLDVSKNSDLAELYADSSDLSELTLGDNSNLTALTAKGAKLASLDISGTPNLDQLEVDDDVAVTGEEKTGLRSQWLVSAAHSEGAAYGNMPGSGDAGTDDADDFSFSYDSNGKLTSESEDTTSSYFGSTYSRKVELEYGDNGKVSTLDYYGTYKSSSGKTRDSLAAMASFTYNSDNMLSSYRSTRGSSSDTVSYEYENGKLAKAGDYVFSYKGNDLVSIATQSNGKTVATENLTYNDYDQLVQKEDDYETIAYEYDNAGNLVKITHTPKASDIPEYVNYTVAFTYDSNGNMKSAEASDESGVTCHADFEYDSYGNMVKRTLTNPRLEQSSGSLAKGTQTFTYTRVFTHNTDSDIAQPVLCTSLGSMAFNYFPLDQQWPDHQVPVEFSAASYGRISLL